MTNHKIKFFLGAASPHGFVSRFEELLDCTRTRHTYILKGGPGTGKSAFMKKVAAAMEALGEDVEYIHCGTDPESLDGIVFKKLNICMADGTPPHTIEPRYPGVFERVISLYDCMNNHILQKNREAIVQLFAENSRLHEKAGRFLAAAGNLMGDTYRFASDCVNNDKIQKFANHLLEKEAKQAFGSAPGHESVRFLSAVNGTGISFLRETPLACCDKAYILDDEYGAVAPRLLTMLKKRLTEMGFDVITCYCPMSPFEKPEHLLVPQLRLAILTSNHFHPLAARPYMRIHAQRFLDKERLHAKKQHLKFNRKMAQTLLNEASASLAEAKAVHDRLEKYYTDSMNFDRHAQKAEALIADLTSLFIKITAEQ